MCMLCARSDLHSFVKEHSAYLRFLLSRDFHSLVQAVTCFGQLSSLIRLLLKGMLVTSKQSVCDTSVNV